MPEDDRKYICINLGPTAAARGAAQLADIAPHTHGISLSRRHWDTSVSQIDLDEDEVAALLEYLQQRGKKK